MSSSPPSIEKSLAERLRERIRREGAITFRDWMAAALYDERDGYYRRSDLKRWGRAGDYRTSPERSHLFAATFASYFAKLYEQLGAPREWTIFEAGAGEGHFALGVLETLRRDYPQIFSSTRYVIDEMSADARERASRRLNEFESRIEFRHLYEVEESVKCGLIFANELLDAFPVHRVTVREGSLREQFVSLDEADEFVFAEHEPRTSELDSYFARYCFELSEGQIAEVNLEVEAWMKRAAKVFERGYMIVVDYGAEASDLYSAQHRLEGTLRAFHRHSFADNVLARPGQQDLTTTIDWTNVRRIAEESGLQTQSFERQDKFLLRVGLLEQLERETAEGKSEADALILRSSVRDFVLPGGMSESFQVLVMRKAGVREPES
ncbi:MAG TPA: SAM-dependent methyltransferase [Pyrinomonadaceae bacterium]|nr:SAM-dependent methyltransferase [Pyrinomonadaceae bacterium]